MTATPEAIAGHYQTSCQRYGYQPGTADMARCVERSAEGARGAGRQGMTEAMTRIGEQQRARAAQYYTSQSPYNRSVTCQSYAFQGTGYTTTNCY